MNHTLDARNLLCPMPVIRLQEFIKDKSEGEIITVLCTDPGSKHDIPAWCRVHGHKIVNIDESDAHIRIEVAVCTK